jgi:NAD(P)H dehydrogenase (quinone)
MKKKVLVIIVMLIFWSVGLFGSDSKNVLVAYFSVSGHTKQMAEAVVEGARSVKGVEVKLVSVTDAKVSDVLWADAIILGSPVYNANAAPAVMNYINRWPFKGAPMRNKIGAAFVSAGGMSAGEELATMNILHAMLIYEMIVVGGTDWKSAFGASAIVEEEPFDTTAKKRKVDPYFLEKAKKLGKRVAEVVLRFK